jgi:hypothetical protein
MRLRKAIASLLITIGCFLMLAAAVAGFACLSSLLERLQHGSGLMFADVEFFALVFLACGILGGACVFAALKLKSKRGSASL